MRFISYAQNFEDVMLWRALRHIKNGFYIDIGAAWPSEDSVTRAFYDRGWRGVNIEPNPSLHHRLCLERPDDINLQLAVSNNSGILQMSLISDTGLSTLQSVIAEKHIQNGYIVDRVDVHVQTLNQICNSLNLVNQPIHFLKVDAEGYEEKVLLGQNWKLFRPWIVVVEATLPMSQLPSYETWEAYLLKVNYTFAYADGVNRFYVANEQIDLLGAFLYPPNVFDEFIQVNQAKEACILVETLRSSTADAINQKNVLQLQLNELQALNVEKQLQLNELQALNEEKQLQLTELQDGLSVMHSHNLGLIRQVEERDAQINAIHKTLSWRVTKPLRWLKHQFRYLKISGLQSRLLLLAKRIKSKVTHLILKPIRKFSFTDPSEKLQWLTTQRALRIFNKISKSHKKK